MHDGMQYDPIQDQGQSREPFKVGNPSIFMRSGLSSDTWNSNTSFWVSELQNDFLVSELNPDRNRNSKTIINPNLTVNHNRRCTVKSETR